MAVPVRSWCGAINFISSDVGRDHKRLLLTALPGTDTDSAGRVQIEQYSASLSGDRERFEANRQKERDELAMAPASEMSHAYVHRGVATQSLLSRSSTDHHMRHRMILRYHLRRYLHREADSVRTLLSVARTRGPIWRYSEF